jgi:hypothetical protein
VLNIAVSHVLLDRTGIDALIGKVKSTGMPEHMWMNRKRQPSDLTSPQNNMAHSSGGQWPAPFRDKQIRRIGILSA